MPDQPRLPYFPVSFFSMIMGLAGLTLAWEKVQRLFQVGGTVHLALIALTGTLFLLLLVLYLAKLVRHPQAVHQELHHPVMINFFPTISISLLLLSLCLRPLCENAALGVWLTGAALHLAFTLYIVSAWMHREQFQIQHINPAWFIPAVGNVVAPIGGAAFGLTDLSWFFFSVGILFWGVLLTIIFYRILFHQPMDQRLLPTLFILIAPPAVGFVAYLALTQTVDNFGRFLYFNGLFLTLLLFTQLGRFVRLQFSLAWWAYSFPLAAISIASLLMGSHGGGAFYLWVGVGLLALLSLLILLLLWRTARAAWAGRICVPPPK